jgi:hypothetical protein
MSHEEDFIDAEYEVEGSNELVLGGQQNTTPYIHLQVGYYRCILPDPISYSDRINTMDSEKIETEIAVGDHVYVEQIDEKRVHYLYLDLRYSNTREEFVQHYVLSTEQEANAYLQRKIIEVTNEFNKITEEASEVQLGLQDFNPHLLTTGGVAVDSTDIALVGDDPAEALRNAMQQHTNSLMKVQNRLLRKQRYMQHVLQAQVAVALTKMKAMEATVARAQEAIYSVSLYLGLNETVYHLRIGEPAPADTKFTIRQLVLFMDEECALDAEEGGIDAMSIEKFDDWIKADIAHVNQLLPEEKGIVALIVRRHPKDTYKDPWVAASMNAANKMTYFLFRNGQNVYRLYTPFDIGKTFLPSSNEYDDIFMRTIERRVANDEGDPDWFRHKSVEVQERIAPGDNGYMEAMEKADARSRHFMRAGLIIQGLLDRTNFFKPLIDDRLSLSDPAHADRLNLIYDGEKTLSDGRERFWDWLTRINSEMVVGHRVIGMWNNGVNGLRMYSEKESGGRYTRYVNERLSPTSAEYPDDDQIYVIEGRKENGFYFLYDRFRSVYDEDYNTVRKQIKSASCHIDPNDRFVLNIDGATIEEMRAYLHSRLDRGDYEVMLPLLKRAIAIKKQEEKDEAPFKELLIGQIMSAYNVDHEDAASEISELVQWYKFGNKYKRALTSDDAKALRMIVEEFGLRQKRKAQRDRAITRYLKTVLPMIHEHNEEREIILIAHKRESEFVVLVAHNEENIFFAEQTWSKSGLREEKFWRTMNNRWMRWHIIEQSERWAKWRIHVNNFETPTDPEIEVLLDRAIDYVEQRENRRINGSVSPDRKDRYCGGSRLVPLAASKNKDGEITLWSVVAHAALPSSKLLTSHMPGEPYFNEDKIKWHRDGDRVIFDGIDHGNYCPSPLSRPWSYEHTKYGRKTLRVYWEREQDIQEFQAWIKQLWAVTKEKQALGNISYSVQHAITNHMLELQERAARDAYLNDGGDLELWPDYKRTKRIKFEVYPRDIPKVAQDVIPHLVEDSVDLNGKTLAEIVALGTRYLADDADTSLPEGYGEWVIAWETKK